MQSINLDKCNATRDTNQSEATCESANDDGLQIQGVDKFLLVKMWPVPHLRRGPPMDTLETTQAIVSLSSILRVSLAHCSNSSCALTLYSLLFHHIPALVAVFETCHFVSAPSLLVDI